MKRPILILLLLFSFKLFSQDLLKYSDGDLEFLLTKVCVEQDCQITKIEVLENGVLKQTIKPGKNNFDKTFPVDQLFLTEDMNFDGRKDFRLMEFLPAGPNIPYLYWIYNSRKDLFEANSAYTEITYPEFDNEKKEINSTWRNGCCQHGRDVYKLINGVPKLSERFIIGHNSEGKEYSEHWEIKNGAFVLIEKKIE